MNEVFMDTARYHLDRADPQIMRNYIHVVKESPRAFGFYLMEPEIYIERMISIAYETGVTDGLKQAQAMFNKTCR